MRLIAGGAKNVTECLPALKSEFCITDEEAEELFPSGRLTVLQSRAHWARTYLGKAGLLESLKRNLHIITARGRDVLAANPGRLDNTVLASSDDFREWKARASDDVKTLAQPLPQPVQSE